VPILDTELLLAALMFLAAVLYTSVGHGGASAYIALMALFGVAPAVMRPTALALNILVVSFASFRYLRAGLFRWRTVWPFLIGAIPLAFIGGAIQLPGAYYRPFVGIVLLIGAVRLLWPTELGTNRDPRDPPIWVGILVGAVIGLLSGLTAPAAGFSCLRSCSFWVGPRPNRHSASRPCSYFVIRSRGCLATSPS
jgi:uncharacterized membrane protein YfcA